MSVEAPLIRGRHPLYVRVRLILLLVNHWYARGAVADDFWITLRDKVLTVAAQVLSRLEATLT